MALLAALIERGEAVGGHSPWPRLAVDGETWQQASLGLAAGWVSLLGLWSSGEAIHMALADAPGARFAVLTLPCPQRRFPSTGLTHPPALRLERAIRDLYGLEADGAPDRRPWLDHGRWGMVRPLGTGGPAPGSAKPYAFLPAEGPALHQIPVGPVHAGIIEPGHFRFTASGETVVRLEARLGYVHRGIEGLLRGAPLGRAAKLAGRISGDSTVAYAVAFARAAEAALGCEAPPRAHALRAIMGELERLANHLGDIGAICNDAAFPLMLAHCGILREEVLRVSDICFGHRLMMDCAVPGGTAADLSGEGAKALRNLIGRIRKRFPELVALYDGTVSLQDRTVKTGILKRELARQFAAGGFTGRASGRNFDARRTPGYPPYGRLRFSVPTRQEGDVNARVWVRIMEVEESLSLIEQLLDDLPEGPVLTDVSLCPIPPGGAEGLAFTEGFRGDILAWVRLGPGGEVRAAHLRDPSWFQWPLLEAAIEGNIVADFPLINKSFNCSYAGHDL